MSIEVKLLHSDYDKEHLAEVTEQMRHLGAPTIKAVVNQWDQYCAVEGCHRLRAALALGLVPTLEVVDYETGAMLLYDESGDYQNEQEMAEFVDGEYDAVWLLFGE